MESNSKDKRVAKAFALIVALTLLMLGFYCLVQEQIWIPSRSSTVEQVVTRPSSYFVGAGTILLGLSIAVTNLVGLQNKLHRNLCLGVMIAGIILILYGV